MMAYLLQKIQEFSQNFNFFKINPSYSLTSERAEPHHFSRIAILMMNSQALQSWNYMNNIQLGLAQVGITNLRFLVRVQVKVGMANANFGHMLMLSFSPTTSIFLLPPLLQCSYPGEKDRVSVRYIIVNMRIYSEISRVLPHSTAPNHFRCDRKQKLEESASILRVFEPSATKLQRP